MRVTNYPIIKRFFGHWNFEIGYYLVFACPAPFWCGDAWLLVILNYQGDQR